LSWSFGFLMFCVAWLMSQVLWVWILVINFCSSHFKIGVYNEYHDNWHCAIDYFVFLNHVEALKGKCHKKVIVVQMRNLSSQFETLLFLYVMSLFFLSSQEIRPWKIWWKETRQPTHWDSIKRVVWHMSLEIRKINS
jgi:hypothetical protein